MSKKQIASLSLFFFLTFPVLSYADWFDGERKGILLAGEIMGAVSIHSYEEVQWSSERWSWGPAGGLSFRIGYGPSDRLSFYTNAIILGAMYYPSQYGSYYLGCHLGFPVMAGTWIVGSEFGSEVGSRGTFSITLSYSKEDALVLVSPAYHDLDVAFSFGVWLR